MTTNADNNPQALLLKRSVVAAISATTLDQAAKWFNQHDPDSEIFYAGHKLREMATDNLLPSANLEKPDAFANFATVQGFQDLEALIRDALAYRALQKPTSPDQG